jgi:UDP-N-acetylglucosamine--N-acetylmuramyl-(pentapeptide) pyrophosphoryl-undecaprenol N-acetylglucosamine transferase
MRIFFCGGGTLGPVTPLIATIEKLKDIRPDIVPVWIGSRKGVERTFVTKLGFEYHWIAAAKLRRYFDLRTLLVPFAAAIAVLQSAWLIMKLHPKAVVVSGSFIQVPLVMTARCLGVPVVLHQLDLVVGLANRISAYDAKSISASFVESARQFGRRPIVIIGTPVRRLVSGLADPAARAAFRAKGLAHWKFSDRPTLIVLGGGTGALGLNERVVKNLDALLVRANVLLVAGKGKMIGTAPRPGFVAVEFLNDELPEALALADLALSRAGMGTLAELGVLGIPSVLVPLLGQQEKNAAFIAGKGAAVAVKNGENDQTLFDTVLRLLSDRDRRLTMSRAMTEVFPADAAEKLSEIIIEVLKQRAA